jgi:hypothetical protein
MKRAVQSRRQVSWVKACARCVFPTPVGPQMMAFRFWRIQVQVDRSKTCCRLMLGLKLKSKPSRVLVVLIAARRIRSRSCFSARRSTSSSSSRARSRQYTEVAGRPLGGSGATTCARRWSGLDQPYSQRKKRAARAAPNTRIPLRTAVSSRCSPHELPNHSPRRSLTT